MDNVPKRLLLAGGALLVTVFVLPPLLGWAFGWGGGGPWMMWAGSWMGFMPVMMVSFWGMVVWAVVVLVQGASRSAAPGGATEQQDSALEVLRRRYARGEIGKEEYEEKRRHLT